MSWWTEADAAEAAHYGWKVVLVDDPTGALLALNSEKRTTREEEYVLFWNTPDDAICKLKVLWVLDSPAFDAYEREQLELWRPT